MKTAAAFLVGCVLATLAPAAGALAAAVLHERTIRSAAW